MRCHMPVRVQQQQQQQQQQQPWQPQAGGETPPQPHTHVCVSGWYASSCSLNVARPLFSIPSVMNPCSPTILYVACTRGRGEGTYQIIIKSIKIPDR